MTFLHKLKCNNQIRLINYSHQNPQPAKYDSLNSRTTSLFRTASQTALSDDNDMTILYTKSSPIRKINNPDRAVY